MGQSICEKLWEFEFIYTDVSREAHNSAADLTDDAIKLLAQKCPSLRRFTLPGTSALTHEALVALFESCPNLSEVEITSGSSMGRNYTDAIFAVLLERQDLAPKLHKLRVDKSNLSSVDMKAMKAVTKQRKKLLVQLILATEKKQWGDWELELMEDSYQRGRLQSRDIYGPGY